MNLTIKIFMWLILFLALLSLYGGVIVLYKGADVASTVAITVAKGDIPSYQVTLIRDTIENRGFIFLGFGLTLLSIALVGLKIVKREVG